MRLRVLDDGRLGYAVLEFDAALHDPALSISVRSGLLHQGMFLGPAGNWQRSPHFFQATRIEGDSAATQYRVGPDVVNYVLEHDRIEVATQDGSVRAEGDWQNAVPEMPGAARTHTIYRSVAAAPVAVSAASAKPEPPPPPPEEAVPEPAAVATEPAPVEVPPAPAPPPPRHLIPLVAGGVALLLVAGAGLALGLVPELRCRLFGASCVDNRLAEAKVCAVQRRSVRPCDVRSCFADYLATTARGQQNPEVARILSDADNACRASDDEAANKARQCVTSKRSANQHCDIQSACVTPYVGAFPNGRSRAELERNTQEAVAACGSEEAAARSARECAGARDASNRPCEIQSCLAPYLASFPNGRYWSEFRNRLNEATRACETQRVQENETRRRAEEEARRRAEEEARRKAQAQDPENRAYDTALACALSSDPCRLEICFQPYLSTYPNGLYRNAARARIEEGTRRCTPAAAGMTTGTYTAQAAAACGTGPQSITVTVQDGKISWQHTVRGIPYSWQGTVDRNGRIEARIGAMSATGVYRNDGHYVDMIYPGCGTVRMTIYGRR